MPDLIMVVDTALPEVPVNLLPLLDDSDFKSREVAVAYNAAGMDLVWNFVTEEGVFTQTAVTPTSGGVYDWTHQGDGMYTIEIPDSGGGSINNNVLGYGWFTGVATGVLPWRGPVIAIASVNLAKSALGLDKLQVHADEITNGLITAAAIATGAIDADAFAANAINAAKLDPDVTTELQNGLATAANLATVAGYLDTEIAAILADTNELQTDWANGGRLDLILDARASQSSLDTLDDFVDTEVAAIKAKTDNLPADPADASDIASSFSTVNTKLDTIDDFLDTEVAAIKAKTDNLPSDPADASDIAALIDALPTAAENADAIWDEAMSGHTTAGTFGDKFRAHAAAVLKTLVTTGSTTTSVVLNATTGIEGAAPSSTNDFYNGRVIIFITGSLAGQATDITDYDGTTKALTVTALTGAPSSGDTAVIV